ncbi:MAG: bacteriohemerythrin [Gallionella sp.]|nr:bacteriohemerythrin [Gallionella sp.]
MKIIWTSDLSTGIDVIDNQHMRIVDYINQLQDAIQQPNRLQIGRVLDELVDYTMSHFAFEESLQEAAGYLYAKPHKGVHGMFVKRIEKYQERHNSGENIAEELHAMLGIWLIHHIKRDDMAYVAEVKDSLLGVIAERARNNDGGWIKAFFK